MTGRRRSSEGATLAMTTCPSTAMLRALALGKPKEIQMVRVEEVALFLQCRGPGDPGSKLPISKFRAVWEALVAYDPSPLIPVPLEEGTSVQQQERGVARWAC